MTVKPVSSYNFDLYLQQSRTFLTKMLTTFFARTDPASKNAKPDCISITIAPMRSRKNWLRFCSSFSILASRSAKDDIFQLRTRRLKIYEKGFFIGSFFERHLVTDCYGDFGRQLEIVNEIILWKIGLEPPPKSRSITYHPQFNGTIKIIEFRVVMLPMFLLLPPRSYFSNWKLFYELPWH